MHKFLLPLLLTCFLAVAAGAQSHPSPIYVAPDAPEWMQMLVSDNPNAYAVQKAYEAYYLDHPFEKNSYTQYYKRWMHWARPYIQADGSIHIPTPEENAAMEKAARAARTANSGAENLAPWTFVGPVSTWDVDANPMVTWQTNVYSLDIAPSNPNILYAGGETGGLWKTTDKGLNWTLLTANVYHGSFTAVKVHPTDPNTVFAGTGGKIIKTTDGGATWTTVYSESGVDAQEFAIHPNNPNIVLAATDKGLLRSTNGGTSWTKLFANNTWTVKNKPNAPDTYFLVRDDNGAGSEFMRSTDAGATWNVYNNGWWTPGSGETVGGAIIAVCPSQPDKIYAYLCGNGTNLYGYIGVFYSTNAGQNWANTNPANLVGNSPSVYTIPGHTNLMAHNGTTGFDQGFYDMAIIVNPSDANQLIAGGTSWFKSTNGGNTWTALGSYVGGLSWSHPDIQWLAASGSDLWITSDGGINYSNNFGASIEARMNGISGCDLWGFGSGWNEDILVGGRYHNGNMGWHESFPAGKFYRLGGAESATGYVSPGPERKVYHSDINGDIIIPGFGNGTNGFSVGLWPNESYAYYANSEMVWHPECWNTVFIGQDNFLWKSNDGGASYTAQYTFPGNADNDVFEIEIARANPLVMYVSQWDGTDDALWRSADGGQTFALCTPLPLPNNNDRVKIAVSDADPNVLWCAVSYGSNGKKIYKTINGGQSWTNLTTATLNNITVIDVLAQYGTDGGVYLGTSAGVFYRNNSHSDWQPYSTGLPVSANTNRLRPFYRDGKIRNGTWGFGVWESPLFEPSSTVRAQAMADKLVSGCSRDTFYFDDYSAVLHDGASWSWTFTGNPQTVIGANTRTPKVMFGNAGAKQAIMTLTTPLGVFRDTLHLSITNGCELDSMPGSSLLLDGAGDYAVSNTPLNLNSNTVTITAWIKRNGNQNDFAGIVFCRGGSTTAGLSLTTGGSLRYHWNDSGWWYNSNLTVPDNEWTHVALVITPSNATIYMNGVPATHNAAQSPEEFNAALQIGYDNGNRHFKGQIEEVCIYHTALTQAQIRESMHLARTHTAPTNASLVAYYQFNETDGPALDRRGIRHLSLVNNATRTTSTCPVGPGVSERLTVTSAGTYNFPNTGVTLQFPSGGSNPNGELCATRLNLAPDFAPSTNPLSTAYWTIHNYGSVSNFSILTSASFDRIGLVPINSLPENYKLYKRGANADGDTWGNYNDEADQISFGPNGSATFSTGNTIYTLGQFVISRPSGALPVTWVEFMARNVDEKSVDVSWTTAVELNTERFRVERSADGTLFEPIGETVAAGNSLKPTDYRFTDADPLPGRSFYRLRVIDRDGSTDLSPIRSIERRGFIPAATVTPNPLRAGAPLQVWVDTQNETVFRLYNEKGQAIRVQRLNGSAQISTEGLTPGMYFYRLEGPQFLRFGKIAVQ